MSGLNSASNITPSGETHGEPWVIRMHDVPVAEGGATIAEHGLGFFCRVPEPRHVQPWLCLPPLTPPPLSFPALFLFRSSGNVPQFCKLPPLFVLLRISLLQRKALPSGALARFIPNSFFYDTASLSFVRRILAIPKLRFKSEAEGLYVRYS
jgi:hypothetical protein